MDTYKTLSVTVVCILSIIDGEPRFGGGHRYRRGTGRTPATAGGGAFHTATLTITGSERVLAQVSTVAHDMGLI